MITRQWYSDVSLWTFHKQEAGAVRYALVRYALVRYALVRYALVRYALVRYALVRYASKRNFKIFSDHNYPHISKNKKKSPAVVIKSCGTGL